MKKCPARKEAQDAECWSCKIDAGECPVLNHIGIIQMKAAQNEKVPASR